MGCGRITLLDKPFEADVKFVARDPSFGIFQFSKKPDLVVVQLLHCIAPWCADFPLLAAATTIGQIWSCELDSASMKIAPENWRVSIGCQGHVALAPLGAVGGKPTRAYRI